MLGIKTLCVRTVAAVSIAALVKGDGTCCWTGIASPTDPQHQLNVTVYWSTAASFAYNYRVQVNFPSTYSMSTIGQPYLAPLGTVSCIATSTNVYSCSSSGSPVFSSTFYANVPDNSNGLTATVSLRGDSGTYAACTSATFCAAVPQTAVDDGLIDFGPFGRRPSWFAIVLAAIGGSILALVAFAFFLLRRGTGGEEDLAKRHEERHGPNFSEKAIVRAESVRRVPTIREVRSDKSFAQSGTLLGGLRSDPREAVLANGSQSTLIGGLIRSEVYNGNAGVLQRSNTGRSTRDTRDRPDAFSPQDMERGDRDGAVYRSGTQRSRSMHQTSPSRGYAEDAGIQRGGDAREEPTAPAFTRMDPYKAGPSDGRVSQADHEDCDLRPSSRPLHRAKTGGSTRSYHEQSRNNRSREGSRPRGREELPPQQGRENDGPWATDDLHLDPDITEVPRRRPSINNRRQVSAQRTPVASQADPRRTLEEGDNVRRQKSTSKRGEGNERGSHGAEAEKDTEAIRHGQRRRAAPKVAPSSHTLQQW